jgi:hypothetical protein
MRKAARRDSMGCSIEDEDGESGGVEHRVYYGSITDPRTRK